MRAIGLCAVAGVIFVTPAMAATTSDAAHFAYWAADAAMAEQRMAKAACDKAQDQGIRAFACADRDKGTQIIARLDSLAKSAHAEPPSDISDPERQTERDLQSLSGAAFDYYYMRYISNALASDLLFCEEAAAQSQDPLILGYVAERLPALEQAYESAHHVEARLRSTAPPPWGAPVSNDHQATTASLPRFEGY